MSWENFIPDASESVKQHLTETIGVSVTELPEDEQKTLGVAICLVKRNINIRRDFRRLREQGMTVSEATHALHPQYHLHPDHIKNIAYKK